jgi:hypothetical protein
MERLRNRFLNVPVDAVLHSPSVSALQAVTEQKDKATMAAEALHRAEGNAGSRKRLRPSRGRGRNFRVMVITGLVGAVAFLWTFFFFGAQSRDLSGPWILL